MSTGSVLISSLDFTSSVGRRNTPQDTTFSDVTDVGGYPFEQKIQRISEIKVFSDMGSQDAAVIVGLQIEYIILVDGKPEPRTVYHGLVHEDEVGDFTISDKQRLVGVHGRLKELPDKTEKDQRIASIGFALFNEVDATLEPRGPYFGSKINWGRSWGTFGEIIGFQGTRTDDLGLTSLGFTKGVTLGSPV